MSLRSRSEKGYARNKATATAWVLSGRPRLRRKGLAWFERHHVPAPDYGRKPGRKNAQPVVEKKVTLSDLPVRQAARPCTCGCRRFERSNKHRDLSTYEWSVINCIACGTVYRQKTRVELMDLEVLERGERCAGCQGTTFSTFLSHGYGHLEDSSWQVLTCSMCGSLFRRAKRQSPQRERRLEPIPPVEDDGGLSWHRRDDSWSSDRDGRNRAW